MDLSSTPITIKICLLHLRYFLVTAFPARPAMEYRVGSAGNETKLESAHYIDYRYLLVSKSVTSTSGLLRMLFKSSLLPFPEFTTVVLIPSKHNETYPIIPNYKYEMFS